jgi:excisionase family DNA binding protein
MAAMKVMTLEDLIRGERFVEELNPQEAAAMLTALAGIQLALANRILTGKQPEPSVKPDDSQMLNVDEVAALLKTTRETIYKLSRQQDWLPFTIRISRKHLRFREAGLQKWIARRANLNSWEAHR